MSRCSGVTWPIKEPNVTLLSRFWQNLSCSFAKRLLQSVDQDETGKQRGGQNEQLELLGQVMRQEAESEDAKSTQESALTLETYEHLFECLTDETSLRHWVKQWMKQEWLALDTETTDLDPKKAQLLGLSICCESGVACYIPVGGSQPIPEETLRAILQPVLAHAGIGKVGHHLKSQRVGMARMGDSGALVGHHVAIDYSNRTSVMGWIFWQRCI